MGQRKRASGEGTVYQRADGLWSAQLTTGRNHTTGRPNRRTVYADTQRGVIQKLDELKKDRADHLIDPGTTTVWGLLDLWLTGHKTQISEGSYVAYKRRIERFLPYTKHLLLSRLNGLAVSQIYQQMERDGVTASERKLSGKLLRQALTWAVRLDFVRHNVALKVPLPRVTRREIHPLTVDQAALLVASTASDRLHALYVVALDSGAREGELWSLEWSDWSPSDNVLSITKTLSPGIGGEVKVKSPKTKTSRRNVPLGELSRSVLLQHRDKMTAEGHGSSLIFPDRDGGHLTRGNYLKYDWPEVLRTVGLPETTRFHDLRHTCASLLLQAGVNVKVVSERLGHYSVVITLTTYAHVMPGMQQEASRIMDGILQPPSSRPVGQTTCEPFLTVGAS